MVTIGCIDEAVVVVAKVLPCEKLPRAVGEYDIVLGETFFGGGGRGHDEHPT